MARIFITGSTEGLGRAAATTLIDEGHEVVLHARNHERASQFGALSKRAFGVVTGDLSSAAETHDLAAAVNHLGPMDAIIHNAGVYLEPIRGNTPEGHARTFAINVLAPWILTGTIARPARLIYLSSQMHQGGSRGLDDLDWSSRRWNASAAYSDSKLQVTGLALAVARRWPNVVSNAVDPGWVPTRMGGPGAPDDLELGHLTQTWLAASTDTEATTTGGYWYHRRLKTPAAAATQLRYQDELTAALEDLTGVKVF